MFRHFRDALSNFTHSSQDNGKNKHNHKTSQSTDATVTAISGKCVSQDTETHSSRTTSWNVSTSFQLTNLERQIAGFKKDKRRYGVIGLATSTSAEISCAESDHESDDQWDVASHRARALARLEGTDNEDGEAMTSDDVDTWSLSYTTPRSFTSTEGGNPLTSPSSRSASSHAFTCRVGSPLTLPDQQDYISSDVPTVNPRRAALPLAVSYTAMESTAYDGYQTRKGTGHPDRNGIIYSHQFRVSKDEIDWTEWTIVRKSWF